MSRQIRNFTLIEGAPLPTIQHQARNLRLSIEIDAFRVQQDIAARTDQLVRLVAASEWLARGSAHELSRDVLADAVEVPALIPCLVQADHWKDPAAHDRLLVHLIESCSLEHPKIDTRIYQNHKLIHRVQIAGTAYTHPEQSESDLFIATGISAPQGGVEADALAHLSGEPTQIALLSASRIIRGSLLATAMPILQRAFLQAAHRAIYRQLHAVFPTAQAFPNLQAVQAKNLLRLLKALPGLTHTAIPSPPPDLARDVLLAQIEPLRQSLQSRLPALSADHAASGDEVHE